MKYFTRHKPSGARAERSIFGTIFKAMVGVLLVEVALLVASIYAMRVGPQLDQNAEDILAMQVENRSRYIQTTLNDAQELSTLESEINALTQELLDSGRIDLATLDSSSITAYPLLEAATPKLIAALRSRPVTGIFLVLNTHDLNERSAGKRLPSIYLRDLDRKQFRPAVRAGTGPPGAGAEHRHRQGLVARPHLSGDGQRLSLCAVPGGL